jgi:hypothetical protein
LAIIGRLGFILFGLWELAVVKDSDCWSVFLLGICIGFPTMGRLLLRPASLIVLVVLMVLSLYKDSQQSVVQLVGVPRLSTSCKGQLPASTDVVSSSPKLMVDYSIPKFDWTDTWCRKAKQKYCQGNDLCQPCQRRWLIIYAPGRTASTTLTEMMARLPGIRMAGENKNAVGQFHNFEKLFDWTGTQEVPEGAFRHAKVSKVTWSCLAQQFLETINPPKLNGRGQVLPVPPQQPNDETTILGFKTIVLHKAETVKRLFPCARILVNIRSDTQSFMKSREVVFDQHYTKDTFDNITQQYIEFYHQLGPERAYLLDSTAWTQNVSQLNDMLDWLGFSDQCHFDHVLQYNTKRYDHGNTTLEINPSCRYVGSSTT